MTILFLEVLAAIAVSLSILMASLLLPSSTDVIRFRTHWMPL